MKVNFYSNNLTSLSWFFDTQYFVNLADGDIDDEEVLAGSVMG